jgi:hypothetical protein
VLHDAFAVRGPSIDTEGEMRARLLQRAMLVRPSLLVPPDGRSVSS